MTITINAETHYDIFHAICRCCGKQQSVRYGTANTNHARAVGLVAAGGVIKLDTCDWCVEVCREEGGCLVRVSFADAIFLFTYFRNSLARYL